MQLVEYQILILYQKKLCAGYGRLDSGRKTVDTRDLI
jgi:hypothetical protein